MKYKSTAYQAHELLVSDARARPEVWRLLVGLGGVAVVSSLLSILVFSAVQSIAPQVYLVDLADPEAQGNTPVSMLILMGGFVVLIAGVMVAARVLQQRTLAGIIGPVPLVLTQFWRVARALAVLNLVLFLLSINTTDEPLITNMALSAWLALLPLSLGVVLIQTSAEEILFRGYIQQTLAARFSSPLIWMVLPAVLFAWGHYTPGIAGENALLVAIWAGVFGLVTADLTARSGTLGPAIALHFVNNIVALLLVSLPETLSGLALYLSPVPMSDTEQMRALLVVDLAMMGVSWLAARLALGR